MNTRPDETAAGQSREYVSKGGQVLTPYICVRDAAAAIDWYRDVLGAVETYERFLDPDGRVGHAEISIDGAKIMLSDGYPDYGAAAPEPGATATTFAMDLYVPDADATVAAAEQAGATVQRAVEDQFYGSRAGTIIDPFGVRWMIGTHVRDVSDEEMAEAVKSFAEGGAEPGPVTEPSG